MGLSGRGAVVDDPNSNEASQAGLIEILLVENSPFPHSRLNNPLTRPETVSKDLGDAAVDDDRLYQAATSVRDIAGGSRHIVELQSLRGIAASIVVVFHCLIYYNTPAQFGVIRNILFNGQGAVVLFFVLSGFVLGKSLIHQNFGYVSVATFYLKRIFRIYPALWVASFISLGYLICIHYKTPHPFASMWFLTRFKVERMRPLHIAASFAGMLAFLLPPLWTIFNEIVGSILIPFATRVSRKKNYAMALTTILLVIAVTLGPRTYYGFGLFLLDFQMGLNIALVVSSGGFSQWSARKEWGTAFMIGAATLACGRGLVAAVMAPNLWMFDPTMHLVELSAASLMIASISIGGLSLPLLRQPAFTRLGDYSYSVYLLHFPIMCLYAVVTSRFIGNQNQTVMWSLVLAALTLATVWLAAGVVYRVVEVPFIRLGRQACLRLGWARASSTVAA